MEEEKEIGFKINKGFRKIGPSGTKIEEYWCTVEGKTLKETSKEFDKQWKEFKDETKK
ncbi:MAG: hypothetical protein IIA87_03460 [Nanoarchaeota archaeon]|nr:hypothetical protein [Nanoarchaeota archaeon]